MSVTSFSINALLNSCSLRDKSPRCSFSAANLWGQAPKTVLKNVIFGLIISSYLKMSRKRRVGAWKVNEDKRFVMVIVAVLGDRFEEGSVGARREDELGWSTHDGRLVAGKEGKLTEIEELGLKMKFSWGLTPRGFHGGNKIMSHSFIILKQ